MSSHKHFYELIMFISVGVTATVVHYCVAIFFNAQGLPLLIANVMAFSLAFVISFIGHSKFTFKLEKTTKSHLGKFLSVSLSALVLSEVLISILQIPLENPKVIMLITVSVMPIYTYLMSKFWAYKN